MSDTDDEERMDASTGTTDETEGITLLGAEMLTWSDFGGPTGPFGGLLAHQLLHDFDRDRRNVLVAGPHSAEVVAAVADQFGSADVLVRSWPDAQQLSEELGDRVRVFCGPLDRMPHPEGGYEAVVALAGMQRLHSLEDAAPTWEHTLDGLVGLLSDTGELFLAVGNDVGIDRLLSLAPEARDSDAAWPEGLWRADQEPGGLDAISGYLAEEKGLARVETWACHGRRSEPLLAAPEPLLEACRLDPLLQRVVGHAYDVPDAATPMLKSPVSTGRDLVRWGMAFSTAPLWVLHFQRRAGSAERSRSGSMFVQVPTSENGPAHAVRLDRHDGGWSRTLVGADEPVVAVTEGVRHDLDRLNGPVPAGETLADRLAGCCALDDLATAGELVRRYCRWLAPDATGQVAGERVPVTPDLLAVDGEQLALLDAGLTAERAEPFDAVLLRSLLVFAQDLLGRGVQRAWPASVTAHRVARSLAAAADLETTDEQHERAVALDRRLRPDGVDAPDFDSPAGGTAGRSYAELVEMVAELSERVGAAEEHNLWLLRQLQIRQRRVQNRRREVAELRSSPEYRYGSKVLRARRAAKKVRDRLQGRQSAPAEGEWRPPKDEAELPAGGKPRSWVEVNLIPPGYVPPEEIVVIPVQEETDEA